MDEISRDASLFFQKKADCHDISISKPLILNILSELELHEADDYRVFEILNTFAVEYKTLLCADLDILKTFVKIITKLLRPTSKPLPEQGRQWAFRVLRWLLVVDPEASDAEELKKCFLMSVTTKTFYLKQLALGLDQLHEKATFLIKIRDDNLLSKLLEGFSEYFKVAPCSLIEDKIISATQSILDQMVSANILIILPDEFVANLIIESDSHYYKALDFRFKTELCKVFVDVFEFEILNLRSNSPDLSQNWFILWLSKDLNQFKQFCEFSKRSRDLFLDQVREEVVKIGRLKGFHSFSAYKNCY